MSYKLLYVNGDSYMYGSKPGDQRSKTAADFLLEMTDISKVVANSRRGSCNSRIVRTTARDILNLKEQFPNYEIIALIGMTFPFRKELWTQQWEDPKLVYDNTDGLYESQQEYFTNWAEYVINDRGLARKEKQLFKASFVKHNATLDYLNDVTLLYNFLRNSQVTPIIFSAPIIEYGDTSLDYTKTFERAVESYDPYVIDLFKFSMLDYLLDKGHKPYDYDEHGKYGHPDEEGHREFALYLYERYKGSLW